MAKYRVVQPWGPDKGRQATLQSEHSTVAEAFAALDAISAALARTGAPSDAIELVVVDDDGRPVGRSAWQPLDQPSDPLYFSAIRTALVGEVDGPSVLLITDQHAVRVA
jgi:hypothetical protein